MQSRLQSKEDEWVDLGEQYFQAYEKSIMIILS